ncbi:sorting nexin 2B-like isoform X2 [Cynara cardunculus var. scolymus]|uniref:sorting nexin 2B-like isoform X2 n=1 Tax=Cynara cardunculus var. scolymus TaxID=59895 RepID=UPI000D623C62|nr:sorting nexin 2B-like isoform X2 [Cynara cardunculus var. scolymus]
MKGSENKKDRISSSKEESEEEILFHLDDSSLTSKSFSNYRSAMSILSDDSDHPLATPAETDPLLSPPSPPPPVKNPNSNNDSRIDPLTYAHVNFMPPNRDDQSLSVENPSEESEIVVPLSTPPYLKITVSNPHKEVESSNSIVPGGNTYVTYLITTKTNMPEFGGPQFTVRRRFKDVVTLSDRLLEAYRGFFIPPRPEKSVVESQVMQKHEFVEQRRNALEKYLQRLAKHPVIRQSDELRVFLQVQGKLPLLPTAAVTSRMLDGATRLSKQLLGDTSGGGSVRIQPEDVVQPAKSRWDFLRIMKEMNQAVSNDWGGSKPSIAEEDTGFLENKKRLLNLEKQLTNASKQAELFVKAQQDMAETMGEFGLAFIKVTKFENDQAVLDTQKKRAADMKNLATTAIKASRLYRELNSHTVNHLDMLHDHMGLLLGVHNAFSDRSSALLTVQTITTELDSLYSQAEKLESSSSKTYGSDKSKTLKLGEVREAIRVTEDAKNSAMREYERIKEKKHVKGKDPVK